MGGGEPEVAADVEYVAFFFFLKKKRSTLMMQKVDSSHAKMDGVCAARKGEFQDRGCV